jgi:hypothetical protein
VAIETIERKLVLNPKVSHLARFLGLFEGFDWLDGVRPPKLNYGTSTTGMAGVYSEEEVAVQRELLNNYLNI